VKAALTKELDDRKSVEDLLRDALQDILKESSGARERAEDRRGRIQITEDVHAAISETRQGALSIALGV
jgi:predicted  nucleic acid-binding Zn-ribbon protein